MRPLDLDDWIELGPDAEGPGGWIAQRAVLLAEHRDTVFAALDGVESESREVGDAVVEHLRSQWPARFGHVELGDGLHPLEAASRLVPEDLVLMVDRDGRLVVGAGSVCFPNRWDLPSRIGRSIAEVHAPVARLNETLETEVDRFLDRLRPDRPFWRLGWGIIDVDDGYTPANGTGRPRPTAPAASELFVRVERETLRRFPDTGCVLFTIRTYVASLASVAPDALLASALAAMSDDVRDYKDVGEGIDELVAALA